MLQPGMSRLLASNAMQRAERSGKVIGLSFELKVLEICLEKVRSACVCVCLCVYVCTHVCTLVVGGCACVSVFGPCFQAGRGAPLQLLGIHGDGAPGAGPLHHF